MYYVMGRNAIEQKQVESFEMWCCRKMEQFVRLVPALHLSIVAAHLSARNRETPFADLVTL
jgi:hypothetical protein